jgi:uncharacterized repeat protein (TIGR03847 family)
VLAYDLFMAEPRPLGAMTYVAAEAIGQPGQRRFRLKALNDEGVTVSLWLEKEQLNALGDAIETVLTEEEYRYQPIPADDREPEPVFPLDADIEFRVGQLSMGVDRDDREIVFIATEAAADDEDAQAVSMQLDYPLGSELRQQIREVVAAGRPPCPLCGAPLDPQGHVCPRTNGHHAQQ